MKRSIRKPNDLVAVAGADAFLTTCPGSGYERVGGTTVSKLNSINKETVLNHLIEKTRDEYSLVSVLFVFLWIIVVVVVLLLLYDIKTCSPLCVLFIC